MAVTMVAESGLLIDSQAPEWFRLQDCPGFQPLKKVGVAEMDFGFVAKAGQTRWLIELKDYSQTGRPDGLAAEHSIEYLIHEFVQKAKDSLLVLGSIWYSLPNKPQLEPDLPMAFRQIPSQDRKLMLAFVVKRDEPQHFKAETHPLQDKLRNKIKGQCELLGIREYCEVFLWDHETAIANGLPLQVNEASPRGSKKTKKKTKP